MSNADDLNQILQDLDALLASLNETEEIGEVGLRIMEKCAATDVGLQSLYSRCASSPLVTVKNAFSFTLAKRARAATPLIGEITYSFVEELAPPFTVQVLTNTFSAIETNHIYGVKWGAKPDRPANLLSVLRTGLEIGGVVRDAAIAVLITFSEVNESLPTADSDIKWLRDQVESLTDEETSLGERAQLVKWLSPPLVSE